MNVVKGKRGRAKGRLTKAADFASTVDINTPLSMLQIRLEKLEETWANFVVLQDEMYEHIENDDFSDPEPEFYEYEAKYFVAHSVFSSFIKVKQGSAQPADQHSVVEKLATQQTAFLEKFNSASKSSVNLPKIAIPSFSGDYEKWPSFKDMFVSSVDQNPSLKPSQKFYYLKSYLSGTAADLVSHMKLTDNNYFEAWDRLEHRFDRSQLIVQAFINSFLSLPTTNSVNVTLLRKITDGADEVIRGLNALDNNSRDPWLIYLLVQKLDPDTKQAWAENLGSKEGATINELLQFLHDRCACLESCTTTVRSNKAKTQTSVRSHVAESSLSCSHCKGNHNLSSCKKFLDLDVNSRRTFVREKSLCFNCLRQGHSANRCFTNQRCKICKSRHHSLVHPEEVDSLSPPHSNVSKIQSPVVASVPVAPCSSTSQSSPSSVVSHHSSESSHSYHTILPTAVVRTQDSERSFQNVRVLLDTGSQVSFITEKTVQRLGLCRSQSRIPVFGVASTSAGVTNGVVTLRLVSRYSSKFVDVDCHVLSKLTSVLPEFIVDDIDLENLVSVELADPYFNKPSSIDVLIGADKVFNIITGPSTEGSSGVPNIIPTIFGSVVAGRTAQTSPNLHISIATFCTQLDHSQEFDLEKFWRLEEVYNEPILSIDDQRAEELFTKTVKRFPDGLMKTSILEILLLLHCTVFIQSSEGFCQILP